MILSNFPNSFYYWIFYFCSSLILNFQSPKGFTSFMTKEDFEAIHYFIRKSCKGPYQHDEYIYERGKYMHSRLITDTAGMVTSGVYKEKLASFDMATNHNHDIRVDIMRETPITPLPVTPEEGFMFERKKKRYLFWSRGGDKREGTREYARVRKGP
jgi:hypothetical protein